MITRAQPAQPGAHGLSPGGDLVSVIVSTIRDVETTLDPAVLEVTVTRVGGQRARMRQLAQALAGRPEVLADGRSPAPQCVGDLLIALRQAGATRISAPVCAAPGCGRELSSAQRRGQDWYCSGCRQKRLREECAGCGQAKPVNTRGPGGQAYCWSCARKDARDPVADIVTVVTTIDSRISADVIAAAAVRAAPGMMACRKLAWALRERPGLLTGGGASAPVLSVLRLIDALADAGARGITKPACPRCGEVKRLTDKLDKVRVCASCYAGPGRSPAAAAVTTGRRTPETLRAGRCAPTAGRATRPIWRRALAARG